MFTFQFLNDKIHNHVKKIIVNFIIEKLKSKPTSLKKYTNWAKLIEQNSYIFLSFWGNKRKKPQIVSHLEKVMAQRWCPYLKILNDYSDLKLFRINWNKTYINSLLVTSLCKSLVTDLVTIKVKIPVSPCNFIKYMIYNHTPLLHN